MPGCWGGGRAKHSQQSVGRHFAASLDALDVLSGSHYSKKQLRYGSGVSFFAATNGPVSLRVGTQPRDLVQRRKEMMVSHEVPPLTAQTGRTNPCLSQKFFCCTLAVVLWSIKSKLISPWVQTLMLFLSSTSPQNLVLCQETFE